MSENIIALLDADGIEVNRIVVASPGDYETIAACVKADPSATHYRPETE